MSDLSSLETALMAEIGAATSEEALEAVRVGALGKKGSVSALLATLGSLPARGAQEFWRRRQRAEGPVSEALAGRKVC